MTVRRFDAPASNTPRCRRALPPHARNEGVAHRIVRLIWLTALLVANDPVSFADYRRRFGVSMRTFRRDITMLRRAGMYIEAMVYGKYKLLFFLWDSDLA